jgi:hypothetical protein
MWGLQFMPGLLLGFSDRQTSLGIEHSVGSDPDAADPDAPRSRGGCSSAALTSIGQVGPSPIGSRYTASTSAASTSRFERAHFVDQEQRARAARFSAALYLHPVADDRLAQRIGREIRELACQPAHEAFPRRSGPRSRRNKSGSRAQQGGRCCYNLE